MGRGRGGGNGAGAAVVDLIREFVRWLPRDEARAAVPLAEHLRDHGIGGIAATCEAVQACEGCDRRESGWHWWRVKEAGAADRDPESRSPAWRVRCAGESVGKGYGVSHLDDTAVIGAKSLRQLLDPGHDLATITDLAGGGTPERRNLGDSGGGFRCRLGRLASVEGGGAGGARGMLPGRRKGPCSGARGGGRAFTLVRSGSDGGAAGASACGRRGGGGGGLRGRRRERRGGGGTARGDQGR